METKDFSILFMGTPYFAARALEKLVEAGFSVIGVVTQPDTAKGRSTHKTPSEVKNEAIKYRIPVFQPENKAQLTDIVQKLQPDLIVVTAFGMIIPSEVLEIPKFGALNIHGSLLPKYRGASPIAEAILNGDEKTGITIMKMSAGMDEGPIVSTFELRISNGDTTESLTRKMAELGAKAIVETIPGWIEGKINEKPQNNDEATYCHKITKEDGYIDWNKAAVQIERMVRAYTPWPSAFTFINGQRIKILKAACHSYTLDIIPAKVSDSISRETQRAGIQTPGSIKINSNRFFVTTGDGVLDIIELQLESKKPMTARDFINGNKYLNDSRLT